MKKIPHFDIIRSHRRSISLQITPQGDLIVKAPFLIPNFIVCKFVEDKRVWIEKTLAKVQVMPVKKKGAISEGDTFLFLGKEYRLVAGNYDKLHLSDNLYVPDFLMFRIKKEIEEWYVREAKKLITARVNYYSEHIHKKFKSLSFSDTISKWGSCMPDNRLQFNWRLIMAPILVIDYVVVHELVHTTIKNHKREFWKEVEEYKPAYKQYIKWLKENSYRLHSF